LLAVLAWRLGDRAPDADEVRDVVIVAGLVAGGAHLVLLAVGSRRSPNLRSSA
jgi:hypothetical protein